MPTSVGWARRLGCSGAPLGFAVVLVALATSPGFIDAFTSIKWYALEAVAATWLVSEQMLCRGRGLPSFVRRTWIGWAVLVAWIAFGALRHGPAWALAPFVARASFVALAVASYWFFRRTALGLGALRGSVAAAAVVVVTLGFLQMAGLRPLPWLAGGDQRSATFGNVNMAAQFVGLALVVLSSRASHPREGLGRRVQMDLLGAAGLAYVVLAGTRSVALALAAGLVVLALVRRSAESWARAGVAAAVAMVVVLLPLAPVGAVPLDGAAQTSKDSSARWRLAVWSDTLDLVRDHPFGVGAGNFEHAFIPYALQGRSRPGEALVFRSPHNDYLRLLAEEGIPGAVIVLVLVLLLLRELNRSPLIRGWRSDVGALLASCGAFLSVEAFFQFPFEMAFPALLSAILLGLAFAATETPGEDGADGPPTGWLWCMTSVLLAAAILVGSLRLAAAEILSATRRDDPVALERACSLDPRRVEACVQAAWLRSRAGDHSGAQSLLEAVLAHSSHYLPAIKLLAEDSLAAGDREQGCRSRRTAHPRVEGGPDCPPASVTPLTRISPSSAP